MFVQQVSTMRFLSPVSISGNKKSFAHAWPIDTEFPPFDKELLMKCTLRVNLARGYIKTLPDGHLSGISLICFILVLFTNFYTRHAAYFKHTR